MKISLRFLAILACLNQFPHAIPIKDLNDYLRKLPSAIIRLAKLPLPPKQIYREMGRLVKLGLITITEGKIPGDIRPTLQMVQNSPLGRAFMSEIKPAFINLFAPIDRLV